MSAGIACAALHKSEFYAKLAFNDFVYVRHSLTALLHKPYILLTAKISYISIIQLKDLKRSIIVIVCPLSTGNIIKIHLLPNLDFFTYPIITNGDR